MMQLLLAGLAFLIGATAGSFLNVCIHRLPRGLLLNQPDWSFCPACNQRIPWHQNFPLLSWVYLRGRCGMCRSAIPARYFLVELLTAGLFLLVWLLHSPPIAIAYWIFTGFLVAAAFIDLEHRSIPFGLAMTALAGGLALSTLVPPLMGLAVTRELQPHLLACLLSLAAAGIGYALLRLLTWLEGRRRPQGGAAILAAASGAFLGVLPLLLVVGMAALSGLAWVAFSRRHGEERGSFPWGAAVAAGSLLWVVVGAPLTR